MRKNPVKAALRQGKTVWGTWITIPEERVVAVIAEAGFDWVTIDMEHAPLDWREADRLVAFALNANITPLIRVPAGDPVHIKRGLDLGAYGLVVPMVESAEQAREIVLAAHFPPRGFRSAAAANHYRRFQASLDEYLSAANEEIMLILQIESPAGIEHAPEIAALPGCDALLIGPLDLACRLFGPAEQFTNEQKKHFETAVQKVITAGREHGCATGFHARSVEEAHHWASQGMQLLAVSSDLGLLACQLRTTVTQLKSGMKSPPQSHT